MLEAVQGKRPAPPRPSTPDVFCPQSHARFKGMCAPNEMRIPQTRAGTVIRYDHNSKGVGMMAGEDARCGNYLCSERWEEQVQ